MEDGDPPTAENLASKLNNDPDAAQPVERLVAFLTDWVDRYRGANSSETETVDPEQLLINHEAGGFSRKRQTIALDSWIGRTYAERRLRDRVFDDPQLFGEPAWDLLLDIALADSKGVRLSVTSACIGACVPSTTALRWLCILEAKGLVTREDDFDDGRRTFVRLTPSAMRLLVQYFEGVLALRRNWLPA